MTDGPEPSVAGASDGVVSSRRGSLRPSRPGARKWAPCGHLMSFERTDMGVQEQEQLWGGETTKAVANFPVSGERIPVPVVRWLGRIKGAAARVNAELGLLDEDKATRIAAAGDRIAEGQFDDQFPIDVFQTGSGTSSNMNANEVIATLAGEGVHANDDVNMGQSSNDVFPSAVHLAALDTTTHELLPALEQLEASLAAKAEEFKDLVKSGRTHLMDAVPVTLGQEFSGYAAQVRLGARRISNALPQVSQIPLGGTATGTGLNTHKEFAAHMRARLTDATGLEIRAARGSVRGPGQPGRARRAVRRAQGAGGLAHEDRQRPGLARLGPAGRNRRGVPARAPEGLVDHARQGQPGDPRGRAPGLGAGHRQRRRDHDRRHAGQLRAQRPRPADRAQPARLDQAADEHVPDLRREVRRRDQGQRGGTAPVGRDDPRPPPPR